MQLKTPFKTNNYERDFCLVEIESENDFFDVSFENCKIINDENNNTAILAGKFTSITPQISNKWDNTILQDGDEFCFLFHYEIYKKSIKSNDGSYKKIDTNPFYWESIIGAKLLEVLGDNENNSTYQGQILLNPFTYRMMNGDQALEDFTKNCFKLELSDNDPLELKDFFEKVDKFYKVNNVQTKGNYQRKTLKDLVKERQELIGELIGELIDNNQTTENNNKTFTEQWYYLLMLKNNKPEIYTHFMETLKLLIK
jgi:hypothetical protein